MNRFRSVLLMAVLFTALGSAGIAHAQERSGAMKFGPGAFTLAGDADFQPLPNLAAVGSVRFVLDRLILQPELQISTRGGMIREPLGPSDDDGSVRMDYGITYVDLPLLAGLTLGGRFAPALFAGPYGGIRIDAQTRLQFDNGGSLPNPVRDVRRLDLGLIGGTSAEVDTRFYRVVVEARGLYGLAPVFTDDPSMHHLGVMLLVGIVF
jgi:hypothetical protein